MSGWFQVSYTQLPVVILWSHESAQELVTDNVSVGMLYIILPTCFWIAIFNHFIPMASPESSDSPQIKFIQECSRGFKTRDLAILAKNLHKDFRNITYPRSLGQPEQTKEEFLECWTGVISLWAADPEVSYIRCSSGPFD